MYKLIDKIIIVWIILQIVNSSILNDENSNKQLDNTNLVSRILKGGDEGVNQSNDCDSCCPQTHRTSNLAAGIWASTALIGFSLAIFMRCNAMRKFHFLFNNNLPTTNKFPEKCVFHGYLYQNSNWEEIPQITLTFQKFHIGGNSVDELGNFQFQGERQAGSITLQQFNITIQKGHHTLSESCLMHLQAYRIENNENPILIGNFYSSTTNIQGPIYLIPQNVNLAEMHQKIINQYVEKQFNIPFQILASLIFVMSIFSILYWNYSQFNKIEIQNNLYDQNIIMIPFGGILGLFWLLICFLVRLQQQTTYETLLQQFDWLKTIERFFTFGFSILSLITGIIKTETSDLISKWNINNFLNYCQVYTELPYTNQNSTCKDAYTQFFIQINQIQASCRILIDQMRTYIFNQSLIQAFLVICFIILLCASFNNFFIQEPSNLTNVPEIQQKKQIEIHDISSVDTIQKYLSEEI